LQILLRYGIIIKIIQFLDDTDMDDNNELIIYVLRQLRYGVPEPTIRETLVQNGWPAPLIDRAFSMVQQASPHNVPPNSYDNQAQPVAQEMSLPTAQTVAEPQPTLRPALPPREDRSNKEPSKVGRRILMMLIILILLAAASVGGYLVYKAMKDNSETAKQTPTSQQPKVDTDKKRKDDLNLLTAKLSSYYSVNQTYPTLAQINSGGFTSNTKGFDISKYKDPSWDAKKSICVSEQGKVTFSDGRADGCYSYRVTALNGADCDADATACTRAVLTANLEGNKPYIIALDRNSQE
jgi:cell division protein FtsL